MGSYRYPVIIFVFGWINWVTGAVLNAFNWSGGLFFSTIAQPILLFSAIWAIVLLILKQIKR